MNNRDDAKFLEAVSTKNFEAIERLFPLASRHAHRLYITGDEFTPLHNANSAGVVQYCISSGVDVNIKNPETDETPLLTAVKLNKSSSVVRELLEQGASIEARNKHTLNTPLNEAVHIVECRPENVQALLEHGAYVNTVNKYGVMPLHKACQNFTDDLKVVELLLKWGALVNRKNSEGYTPLSVALQNPLCTAGLLNLFLKFNANVSLANIQSAFNIYSLNVRNNLEPLLQRACVTDAEGWRDILRLSLLMHINSEKIRTCGRLVIKHSFLHCGDPYKALVDFLLAEKKKSEEFLYRIEEQTLRNANLFYRYGEMMFCGAADFDHLLSFANDCSSEMQRMKADTLENTSMYEIVTSKTPKLCTDNKILEMLEENRYPIYRDLTLSKIKKASLVDKLMAQEVYAVVQNGDIARRIVLDALSVSCIAVYLDEEEVKNFVDAFCDPSKEEYFWDKLVKIETGLSEEKLQRCGRTTPTRLKTHLRL